MTPSSRFAALSAAFDAAKDTYAAAERFRDALLPLAFEEYDDNVDLYNLLHMIAPGHIRQARDRAQELLRQEPAQ